MPTQRTVGEPRPENPGHAGGAEAGSHNSARTHNLEVIPEFGVEDITAAAAGLGLTESDVTAYTQMIRATVETLNELGTFQSPIETGGGRASWVPSPEDNPWRAWYRRTEIQENDTGTLAGLRVAFKDNILLAGVPLGNGTPILDGYSPGRDATVVSRVLGAGGTVTGKAVCEPMSLSGTGHTAVTGPVLNPHDPSRLSGGSSSGSAVLVASGAVDASVGADNGGSVRIPASWCGVYGLKPTRGAIPYTGVFSVHPTLDHVGLFARSPTTVDKLFSALVGADGKDPRQNGVRIETGSSFLQDDGPRLGVLREGFGWEGTSDPTVDESVLAAIDDFRRMASKVVDISIPLHRTSRMMTAGIMSEIGHLMFDNPLFGPALPGDYHEEAVAHVSSALRANLAALPAPAKLAILTTRLLRSVGVRGHHERSLRLIATLSDAYDEALETVDVLALPTTPTTALALPPTDLPIDEELRIAWGQSLNTRSFNTTGHPVITLPCGLINGLPVGMSLVGRVGADRTVLHVARLFQEAIGGAPEPPTR